MFMRYKVTVNTSHYPKEGPWELPEGWVKCKLSDVCQFESGFAFKSESYKKKGVPLIRISNIQEGTITTDGGVCIQEVVESRFHIVKGDLLIALSGATTGKMGIYDKDDDALLNQRVGNLRVISKTCFLPEYRNLFMESQAATILEQAWGGAQPNNSPNTIIGFDILLPPYAEQCRIVSKANELLAIVSHIESAQDQIETTADGIKTKILDLAIRGKIVPQDDSEEPAINLLRRINPAFQPSDNLHYEGVLPNRWSIIRLGDVIDVISGTSYQKTDIVPTDSGIRILRGGNIQNGMIVLCEDDVFVNHRLSDKHLSLYRGDIALVASTGSRELIGKAAIAKRDYQNTQIGAFLRIIRPKATELSDYLGILFQSDYYKKHIQEAAKGTNINNIKTSYLTEFVVPLPPIKEQQRIIEKVNALFLILNHMANLSDC